MALDTSFPSWLVPKSEPWQAMVSGVQAGAQIAAIRQRGQALGMQLRHQALEEEVAKTKFNNDQADLAALKEWWPQFANYTGQGNLEPPVLRNPTMLNRINGMVADRKTQYDISRVARTLSTADLLTPEGKADYMDALADSPAALAKMGGLDGALAPIKIAEDRQRLKDAAAETRRHHLATEERLAKETEREDFDVFFDTNTKRWYQWRNNAAYPVTSEEVKSLSPSTRASIYKQQIDEADKELYDLPTGAPKTQIDAIKAKRKAAVDARDAMVKAEGTTATPGRVRVRNKATGQTGWWEGGAVPAEYETIPE